MTEHTAQRSLDRIAAETVSLREAAGRLGVSYPAARGLVARGVLDAVRFGTTVRVVSSSLEEEIKTRARHGKRLRVRTPDLPASGLRTGDSAQVGPGDYPSSGPASTTDRRARTED